MKKKLFELPPNTTVAEDLHCKGCGVPFNSITQQNRFGFGMETYSATKHTPPSTQSRLTNLRPQTTSWHRRRLVETIEPVRINGTGRRTSYGAPGPF
jgi:hypothetical protein